MESQIRIFASARSRRTAVLYLGLLVGLLIFIVWLTRRRFELLSDPAALRAFVASFGVFAPIAFISLQAAQVVIAPVPGHVMGFVSGYLFGSVNGTVYSLIGTAIGSAIAFSLARRFGRPFVEHAIHPDTLDLFDDFVDEHGLLAMFVVFLVPGLPDDALCFVGGLTRIPVWQLVIVSVVGRFPGFALANLAGDWFAQRRLLAMAGLIGLLLLLSIIGYLARDRIAGWINGDDGPRE